MAAFSVRSPTWQLLGISLFLLLVLPQHISLLVFRDVVFIFHIPLYTIFFLYLLTLCFYVPVVLVAFALLALLLAAYAKDRTTLKFSVVCQAASSSLLLTGLISSLLLRLSFSEWKNMTFCFCISVSVLIELAITILLTVKVYKKYLLPDWK